jgi:hypothetical protein
MEYKICLFIGKDKEAVFWWVYIKIFYQIHHLKELLQKESMSTD